MKQILKATSLLLLIVVFAACGTGGFKTITTQSNGDYNIVVLSKTGSIKQGKGKFFLEFRKASDNQLASVGIVNVRAEMPMPGMPMVNDAKVEPQGKPGQYEVEYDLAMAGTWTVHIKFETDRSATISLSVS